MGRLWDREMKEGPPDLLVPKRRLAGASMGGGDAGADGRASDAVEVGDAGDSVSECQVPPVGASVQAESAAAMVADKPEDPPGDWLEPLEEDEDEDEDWQSVDSSLRVNGSRESLIGETDGVGAGRKQIGGGSEPR